MAGLLDSDLMQFLVTPRAFMARRNAQADAQQFQGLLGSLEQQGPVQPGGVLESRAPDQQFWLKAMQIPTYQDVASQQLGYDAQQSGAMARQQQQQQYEGSNLTMMQRLQAELAQRKAQFEEQTGLSDLHRKWAGTNASIGAAGAAAQNSGMGAQLKQLQILSELQKQQTANGPLFGQLPADKKMAVNQQNLRNDAAVASSEAVLDWVLNRDVKAPLRGVGSAQGGAMAADWMLSALPVMKDMVGAGALDEGERKWMLDVVGSPDALHLTESEENKMKLIVQKMKDYRTQGYKSVGLDVPQIEPRGAVGRSQGVQPQGALKPYTPTPRPAGRAGGMGLLGSP